MSYEISIVADSVSPAGARITTFKLRFPRFVLSQLNTHRALSRNARSSRAVPVEKMVAEVESDPVMPVEWGRNRRGMQAAEEISPREIGQCKQVWLDARDRAVRYAKAFSREARVHKQICNRLLEPFMWADVVATATAPGWMNFFALRCHADAQPEMRHLAVLMARAYRDSMPRPTGAGLGNCHLPFVGIEELVSLPIRENGMSPDGLRLNFGIRLSVARCARVSYLAHDGKASTHESDLKLANDLESNGHWSPFEHQAWPLDNAIQRSGNLAGWMQYRQSLPKSVHAAFDFSTLEQWS